MVAGIQPSPQHLSEHDPCDTTRVCSPAPNEIEEEVIADHFPFVLGRHPECDLSLFSRQISRRHCQFFQRSEEIWIEDLNSYNGTYLGDHEVRQAQVIHDGDILVLHPYRYQCHLEKNNSGEKRLRLVPDGMERLQ
jgi:pSer/pThr/pTyr-binding forkhead associated (FHA) protein